MAESTIRHKASKKRSTVVDSEDEFEQDGITAAANSKPAKRARTEEHSVGDEDIDVDGDGEVNVGDEDLPDDTRFLPERSLEPISKRGSAKKGKLAPRRPKKRTVVLSDDEGDRDDYEDNQDVVVDGDDDDPTPVTTRRVSVSRIKGKAGKLAAVEKKSIANKIASSREGSAFTGRRAASGDEMDDDEVSKADSAELAAPPPKKRKLPPIKKNKPHPGTSATSSTAGPRPTPKPLPNGGSALDGLALPVAGARKPAATANNADFDLRDKSVYASLFMKVSDLRLLLSCTPFIESPQPGGATPNSGLSRKEKEEERRKELSKMREEARAKRAAETVCQRGSPKCFNSLSTTTEGHV